MDVRPTWVGAAALTVLSCASAAALSLSGTTASAPPLPLVVAPPAAVVATDAVAPSVVSLTFPAVAEPAPAPAPVTRTARRGAAADPRCSGEGWQARRGAAAVASLRRPADAAAVRVQFRPARSDVLGLAHLRERRVEIFVRPCTRESDALLRHVLAHELGHVLDATRMTAGTRAEWMRLRGIPSGTPWFGCDGCTDFATPAGDFAEVYAQWQRRATSNRSELAPAPSGAELGRLAQRFFAPL